MAYKHYKVTLNDWELALLTKALEQVRLQIETEGYLSSKEALKNKLLNCGYPYTDRTLLEQ